MAKQLLKGPIKYLIKMKNKNKYRKIRERIDAVILRGCLEYSASSLIVCSSSSSGVGAINFM